ncbi:MAG: GNAT family N-acetyltransferase [Aestuariivirga sp.]|uniref:GNAT family N-acetyltransferase n=1 Tax=Aestuariivirga sp. TaxID=2650926 RepID=UPI0025B906B0|nr:GNAT family N-acetyltransferase [Aestuariivirga sp.]MCA3560106.1 GNAT family N-acetyltransferase [Aestuariivirga sp.]
MTILVTDRLTLRPPEERDRQAMILALNNLNVSRWTGRIPYPYGPEDAEAFFVYLRQKPEDALVLAITRNDALIGVIGLEGELGYWLAEPHWGQGYATEAARSVVDHAFSTLGCEGLEASYHLSNTASRRILLGLGFQETGEDMAFSRARAAQVPTMRLELTRDAWAEAKARRP